ncbi:MAG: hypothetical protein MUP58_01265 [Candidatus Nanohaloarchaeota archaeon QJJ-9]|nr:hypothetical protein [Candidatus Nanohaloarchaeota archaeon QJJ-9]
MDLFGKKRLEKKIEELEDRLEKAEKEKEQLREKSEREEKRAKEAITRRQELEKNINRKEDKIKELEDKLEKDEPIKETEPETKIVNVSEAKNVLKNLKKLEFGSKKALTRFRKKTKLFREKGGEVVFIDPTLVQKAIYTPISLEKGEYREEKFEVDRLEEMIDRRYCLVHASIGGSGTALIDKKELKDSKIVKADIKSKHKKGGYSQKRFDRVREKQLDEHVDKLAGGVEELLEKGFEDILVSGNSKAIEKLEERLGYPIKEIKADVSKVEEEKDLKKAFETGLSFKIRDLTDEEARKEKEENPNQPV